MKKIVLGFILLFGGSQAKYNVVDFVLENGLRVVCIEKKTSPITFFSIWYRCGSKCDAISKSGAAHYLEHMAFVANKMEFSNFLEDVGADKNAFTSINAICFHELVPKENIETVFIHESRRMISLDIDDDAFLSEKGAILEERSTRVDNDPNGASQESLLSNIFNREAGGIGIIGWKHEIQSITKKDLYKFHRKWFAPNNAVVVLSGDFDLNQIKKMAEKYFGKIPPKKLPKRVKKTPSGPCLKEIKYGSPKNGSASVAEYIYRTPFSSKESLKKTIALEVALKVMNRPASFVKKILKDALNHATEVAFSYVDRLFQYDIVVLEIASPSIDDLGDAENAWRYLKNKLAYAGVLKSELDAVKRQELVSLAYKKDDIIEMSNYFGWLLINGYSVDEIQSIDDMIQEVSEKECNDLLREIFSQDPIAIFRILPKSYDRE
ncbi:MAG: insulinase family protein [Holosporaceae bacterium]|nr:insulinase family protein [Holosporaceae bacterium]